MLLFFSLGIQAQTIRYVRQGGSGDGSSWANATGDLQTSINAAGVQQVWVAAGIYKPTTGTDRTISFSMKNGVAIYGGFPTSGNPGLAERSPSSYTTTLSGDIGAVNNAGDNSYSVIYNPSSLSLTNSAVLDGFVIKEGNMNGNSDGYQSGAGMLNEANNGSICSPTVTNCVFTSNTTIGGGSGTVMYNRARSGGEVSPVIVNCSFVSNDGGALRNDAEYDNLSISNPIITNCIFVDNSALAEVGGIYNDNSNAQIANCTFIRNSVYRFPGGGAISNGGGSPRFIGCNFIDNFSIQRGGLLYAISGNPLFVNCLFINNGGSLREGGCIINGSANIRFINCSFNRNTSDISGTIDNNGVGSIAFTNCILWDNGGSKTFSGPNITNITVNSSLLEPGVTGYTNGSRNLTTATSPFDSDLRLKAGSPAINAGSNSAYTAVGGPTTDLAGSTRIQYSLIDMGAYESGYSHDLTPILYVGPSVSNGTTPVTVVLDLVELNAVTAYSLPTIRITRDSQVKLDFDASLTTVGGRTVQNNAWSFDTSDPNYYKLTPTQPIGAGSRLSVGLSGTLSPGATTGKLTVSSVVVSSPDTETKLINNIDAEKVDYFR